MSATWPFDVNWRNPYTVSYEYKTDIFTSRSGREQRRALRADPRMTVSFMSTVARDQLRSYNGFIVKHQSDVLTITDPTRVVRLRYPSAQNTTLINVRRVPDWIIPGILLLFSDGTQREIREVLSIGDGQIIFTTPTAFHWYQGTAVYGVFYGQTAASLQNAQATNAVAEPSIILNATPGQTAAALTGTYMLAHAGREVLLRTPNWSADVQFDWGRSIDQVDFGFGIIATYRPVPFSTRTFRATFLVNGREDADDLLSFFDRQKGQRGDFYLPTGQNDLPPMVDLVAGDDTYTVAGTDTFDYFDGDLVHQAFALLLNDNRTIFRSVLSMSVVNGNTVIVVDSPWQSDVQRSKIFLASWMPVHRNAVDQVQIAWETDAVGQAQVAFSTLPSTVPAVPIPVLDGAAAWAHEAWASVGQLNPIFDALDLLVNVQIGWSPLFYTRESAIDDLYFDVNITYPRINGTEL